MVNNQTTAVPDMQSANFPAYVQQILTTRFGTDVNVSRSSGEQKVSGYIVWQGFTDIEPIDRQHEIRHFLRQELGSNVQGVSIILAYSPQEWTAMHED